MLPMARKYRLAATAFLLLVLTRTPVHAEKLASIIIDDVGNNLQYGEDVINLPATLTIAILPKTTYARKLARLAASNNKEVMLHLPMQSVEHHVHSPGTLDLHMTNNEFRDQVRTNLNSVPYVRGVNNHMGSLLTKIFDRTHLGWDKTPQL